MNPCRYGDSLNTTKRTKTKKMSILKTTKLKGFRKTTAEKLIKAWLEANKHYWKWCEKNGRSRGYCEVGYARDHYEPDNLEMLNNPERQERLLTQLSDIRKAIKNRRLVVKFEGGLKWSAGYIKGNEYQGIGLTIMKLLCPYRINYNDGNYTMSCYGTSRPLEIILSYGYNLGLTFHDIPQRQQII